MRIKWDSYPMVRDKYQAKNSNKKQTGKMQEKGINLKSDYVNDTRTQWEKTSKYNYVRYFYFFALEIDVLPLCTFRPFSRYYFLFDIYNATNHSNLPCFFHVNPREFNAVLNFIYIYIYIYIYKIAFARACVCVCV